MENHYKVFFSEIFRLLTSYAPIIRSRIFVTNSVIHTPHRHKWHFLFLQTLSRGLGLPYCSLNVVLSLTTLLSSSSSKYVKSSCILHCQALVSPPP